MVALLAVRRDLADGTRTRQAYGLEVDFAHKMAATATSLEGSKN